MRGVKLAEDGRLLSELLEYSCSIFGRILRRLLDGDSRPDSTPWIWFKKFDKCSTMANISILSLEEEELTIM